MSENRRPSPPSAGSPFGGPGSGRGPGGPGRGPGPAGRMMPGEKAKDLKGSLKKLVKKLK